MPGKAIADQITRDCALQDDPWFALASRPGYSQNTCTLLPGSSMSMVTSSS